MLDRACAEAKYERVAQRSMRPGRNERVDDLPGFVGRPTETAACRGEEQFQRLANLPGSFAADTNFRGGCGSGSQANVFEDTIDQSGNLGLPLCRHGRKEKP